jgi:single-strand DNA-binding protein
VIVEESARTTQPTIEQGDFMPHPADVHVTLIGTVASAPDFAVCGNGAPRASFRLAVPERRFDRETAAWVIARISYYIVVCWRALAEHVGSSLGRGDPVIVTGRQRIVAGAGVEVDATAVGHDLRYGLSSFRTMVRRRLPDGAPQLVDADPFATPIPGSMAEATKEPTAEVAPAHATTSEHASSAD